jgi:hypothetical protein
MVGEVVQLFDDSSICAKRQSGGTRVNKYKYNYSTKKRSEMEGFRQPYRQPCCFLFVADS